MAVYTSVKRSQLEAFLADYEVGTLVDYRGIEAGIENTNYFVTTTTGAYVLTLFEAIAPPDISYALDLMAHLSRRGVACAQPLANRDSRLLGELGSKPATLVRRLSGASIEHPTPRHCRLLGAAMARMHLAAINFSGWRPNDRGVDWRRRVALALQDRMPVDTAQRLSDVLSMPDIDDIADLPSGAIHADLFRDNALFEHGALSGILDFYYARNGAFIYDLAVAVADWCWIPGARFDVAGARALLDAYAQIRPLSDQEKVAWATAMASAARRFWLSRLADSYAPRPGELTKQKDPAPFAEIIVAAAENPAQMDAVWA